MAKKNSIYIRSLQDESLSSKKEMIGPYNSWISPFLYVYNVHIEERKEYTKGLYEPNKMDDPRSASNSTYQDSKARCIF